MWGKNKMKARVSVKSKELGSAPGVGRTGKRRAVVLNFSRALTKESTGEGGLSRGL